MSQTFNADRSEMCIEEDRKGEKVINAYVHSDDNGNFYVDIYVDLKVKDVIELLKNNGLLK